jgi:hypothetical protein
MKTKEINCFALCKKEKKLSADNVLVAFSQSEVDGFLERGDIKYKAKLIIEIPERKKMLSESEVRDALHTITHEYNNTAKSYSECVNQKIEKLFGGCDE